MYALARDFPHLHFTLNGGIRSVFEVKRALEYTGQGSRPPLSGVMVGRGIQHNPVGVLAYADTYIYGAEADPCPSRRQLLERYVAGCEEIVAELGARGINPPKLRVMSKPLVCIFSGVPGNRHWRFRLDQV